MRIPSFQFPADVYSDVRFENVHSTTLRLRDGEAESSVHNTTIGAYLRVCRDGRWQGASTTDLSRIGPMLQALAKADSGGEAGPDAVALLTPHQAEIGLTAPAVSAAPVEDKVGRLRAMVDQAAHPLLTSTVANYIDEEVHKCFLSSAGADVRTSRQRCGLALSVTMDADSTLTKDRWQRYGASLDDLNLDGLDAAIERIGEYARFAKPLEPGDYPVVLSPKTAGVFAHESFGHRSEADFMMGDAAMLEAWQLGKHVGADCLSIVDDGGCEGTGEVRFDDEGQPSHKTWLIRNGVLTGRLHSTSTAAALGESTTGNARAMDFRFGPIVRMTSTYIAPGTATRDEVFGVEDGLYVENFGHGSGVSTFTIAPTLAWRIRKGKLAEPVRVAVITGNVFETLGLINAVSSQVELLHTVTGGCGKGEQFPLPVSYGGPYVRVSRMKVA